MRPSAKILPLTAPNYTILSSATSLLPPLPPARTPVVESDCWRSHGLYVTRSAQEEQAALAVVPGRPEDRTYSKSGRSDPVARAPNSGAAAGQARAQNSWAAVTQWVENSIVETRPQIAGSGGSWSSYPGYLGMDPECTFLLRPLSCSSTFPIGPQSGPDLACSCRRSSLVTDYALATTTDRIVSWCCCYSWWRNHNYGLFAAAVAERLDCSPLPKVNRVQSPSGSLPDFRKWDSFRTMSLVGGFSRRSPVSTALVFRRCSIPASFHAHRISRRRC
ncbi:hypothetical protein PR048_007793 [Dryococelus australis]|uniref:Uncharacterized protein n=1 Tax=Dryococelus australis TaxID=614101 RepID=A0ABQ9HW44_9NEOP|nr:hypothetical protein PR048_007793 [Dryococelus australis]